MEEAEGNWSFIKAEMYNMPNILSNTLHELLDYSFAASMNFPLLLLLRLL